MEYIRTHHMQPGQFGKSYFCQTMRRMTQTIVSPDKPVLHDADDNKWIYQKEFPHQTGIGGKWQNVCYSVTAICYRRNNILITAFPIR